MQATVGLPAAIEEMSPSKNAISLSSCPSEILVPVTTSMAATSPSPPLASNASNGAFTRRQASANVDFSNPPGSFWKLCSLASTSRAGVLPKAHWLRLSTSVLTSLRETPSVDFSRLSPAFAPTSTSF